MRDSLAALGWSEIEVIDDDLGRSAAGGVQRAAVERMVAQVCLGRSDICTPTWCGLKFHSHAVIHRWTPVRVLGGSRFGVSSMVQRGRTP